MKLTKLVSILIFIISLSFGAFAEELPAGFQRNPLIDGIGFHGLFFIDKVVAVHKRIGHHGPRS